MRTDYVTVIGEDEVTLRGLERQVRGRPTAVQALRLLKSGVARSLAGCAALVGHSPRQVARWWALYRQEGVALAEHHGIVSPSLNGVWAQLRKHQMKPKTGRRRHALDDAAAQEAFRAGFRDDAAGARRGTGLGL